MSSYHHFVYNLKSYIIMSQKTWTIYQPTSSLIGSTRGIALKEKWLYAICYRSHNLRGMVRGTASCAKLDQTLGGQYQASS